MEQQFKPIMVFYLPFIESQFIDELNKHLLKVKERLGYEQLILSGFSEDQMRVEIISVDKAAVVEDIQKYIDLQLLNFKK